MSFITTQYDKKLKCIICTHLLGSVSYGTIPYLCTYDVLQYDHSTYK